MYRDQAGILHRLVVNALDYDLNMQRGCKRRKTFEMLQMSAGDLCADDDRAPPRSLCRGSPNSLSLGHLSSSPYRIWRGGARRRRRVSPKRPNSKAAAAKVREIGRPIEQAPVHCADTRRLMDEGDPDVRACAFGPVLFAGRGSGSNSTWAGAVPKSPDSATSSPSAPARGNRRPKTPMPGRRCQTAKLLARFEDAATRL